MKMLSYWEPRGKGGLVPVWPGKLIVRDRIRLLEWAVS